MQPQSERGSTDDPVSGAGQEWLGNPVWQTPGLEVSKIRSWASITAVSYHRDAGEFIRRGDRHRLILIPDQIPPRPLQVEQGATRQLPAAAPGSLTFCPAGLTLRTVQPAARFVQVLWDTDVYSALLPELGAAVSGFEFLYPLEDPLLSQVVTTLAEEVEGRRQDPDRKPGHCLVYPHRSAFCRASPAADQQGPLAGALAARARLRRGTSR
jgi:hypothetical protein